MFSARERIELRDALLTAARSDGRVTGVAVFGSAAIDREDAWSDVDIMLGVGAASDLDETLADWTAALYRDHGALHHVDLPAGTRSFLLPGALQVDLLVVPAERFGPRGPKFRLVAGRPHAPAAEFAPPPSIEHLAGLAWLYAVQVRSCLGRGRSWQALRMLAEMRDQVMSLACVREGLPVVHGVGFDLLPRASLERFRGCLPRELDEAELRRAFDASISLFLEELDAAAPDLRRRIDAPVRALADREAVGSRRSTTRRRRT